MDVVLKDESLCMLNQKFSLVIQSSSLSVFLQEVGLALMRASPSLASL